MTCVEVFSASSCSCPNVQAPEENNETLHVDQRQPAGPRHPLVRAVTRWENEGGRTDADWEERAALIQEEGHILQCLGAAVIARWNNLPTDVQPELFASAVSVSDPLPMAELKEQIARFLLLDFEEPGARPARAADGARNLRQAPVLLAIVPQTRGPARRPGGSRRAIRE